MMPKFVILGALLAAAGSGPLAAQDAPEPLGADLEAAFVWLDRFDPFDTSSLPYGHLLNGTWWQTTGDLPVGEEIRGFLLADDGADLRFRGVDLHVRRVRRKASPLRHERVDFEPADPGADARSLAAEFRASLPRRMGRGVDPDHTLPATTEALLLARACARRGLAVEARELAAAVAAYEKGEGPLSLLEDGLRFGWWWQTLLALGDPGVSRTEIVERCRRHREFFPDGTLPRDVERLERGLASLVEEEAAAARVERAGAGIPDADDAQIASWTRALRDQTAPVIDHEFNDALAVSPHVAGAPEPPSRRLQAAGLRAVPRLIEAVANDRPSRCVYSTSRRGGAVWVVLIGELAQQTLEEILCADFDPTAEEPQASPGIRLRTVQAKAWSHWEKVQAHGEEAVLVETAAAGTSSSLKASKRLKEKFPDRAADAALRGARAAATASERETLVTDAGTLTGDAAIAFLLEELTRGPFLVGRVAAAEALHRRGRPEALAVMVAQWRTWPSAEPEPIRSLPADAPPAFAAAIRRAEEGSARLKHLIFLVSSGTAAALRAILDVPPPVEGTFSFPMSFAHTIFPEGEPADPAAAEDRREAARILEEILVRDLEIAARGAGEREVERAAKVAAALAGRWPGRYVFDEAATPRVRERQIATIRNAGRSRSGQPPVPVPEAPRVEPVPDEVSEPVLDAIAGAADAEERRLAIERLLALGPGAQPAAHRRLEGLPAEHAARADLQGAIQALANTVIEARVQEGPEPVPEAVAKRLATLRGRPLAAADIIDLFLHAVAETLESGRGVVLGIERPGAATGILVGLTILPSTGGGSSCQFAASIRAGGESFGGGSGAGGEPTWTEPAHLDDERLGIERALAAAPERPVVIRLERVVR